MVAASTTEEEQHANWQLRHRDAEAHAGQDADREREWRRLAQRLMTDADVGALEVHFPLVVERHRSMVAVAIGTDEEV